MQALRNRRHLCPADALGPGEVVTFEAVVRGEQRPCFAVRLPESGTGSGRFAAFLNICAHRNQPVVVDDRPFDEQNLLECRAHGAQYEPATGLCVRGPCVGAQLVEVLLELHDGELYALDDDAVDDSMYGD